MTHREQRVLFTSLIAELVLWARSQGWSLAFAEGKITSPRNVWLDGERVSLHDAVHKFGSYHYRSLAQDLDLYIGDEYIADGDHVAWKLISAKWESMHPLATAGRRWNDANHLSFGEGSKEGALPV